MVWPAQRVCAINENGKGAPRRRSGKHRTPHAAGLLQMVLEIGTRCIVRQQYMSLPRASRSVPELLRRTIRRARGA